MSPLVNTNTSILPTVSVVTVAFNVREEIVRTMDSVLEQDYPNIEYIVIDGKSTDGTRNVIRQYEDKLDVLVCERDQGIYDAMNKGIARSRGEWLVFMNAGDVFTNTDALNQAVSVMSHDVDVVFSDWIYRETSERITADLGKLNVRHQSVIYRKSLHQTYSNYIVGKGVTISDYLFFLSIAHKKWAYCKSPIAICDKAGASSSPRHFYQRIAAELIFGKRSVLNCCGIFLLYPFYRYIKRNILRIR